MAFGLGVLRLSPAAFWRMTLRELSFAVAGATGRAGAPAPLRQAELSALMQAFPDPGGP